MKPIRTRITYANVMSTIAVFLVVGGATAFAATHIHLHRNSVGSRQLRANSVTEKKLKRGAVTEKKIANGAVSTEKLENDSVTGAKVKVGTLGTVPSASTYAGYTRKGIVRAAASPSTGNPEASLAAAPEVPLLTTGPFTVYGKCFEGAGETIGSILIKTSENGAILDSGEDRLSGEPFLDVGTAEKDRTMQTVATVADKAAFFGVPTTEFSAMAPIGTVVRGDAQIGVKNGELAGGNGIYGAGNVCLFAAQMTALSG